MTQIQIMDLSANPEEGHGRPCPYRKMIAESHPFSWALLIIGFFDLKTLEKIHGEKGNH
jgi:hypothetical protein